jgi:Holliday junction resolvase RusA-like endonuclease
VTSQRRAAGAKPRPLAARTEPLTPGSSISASPAPGDSQKLVIEDFPTTDVSRALSPNGRAHWATKRQQRMHVASEVVIEATRSGLRPVSGPVRLTFRYVFPEQRKRDVDNLTSGVTKACIDALVRGRWLPADDSEHVLSVRAEPIVERGCRRLEITIEPVV